MFPALTFARARDVPRRAIGLIAGGTLSLAALAAAVAGNPFASSAPPESERRLADRLAVSTWALVVPNSWLAAPLADLRAGDSVDLLAIKGGDRPLAVPIAADLRVMSASESGVVFQVDEDAAAAIVSARASSLLLVPLLRSTK
jgi:hypothetical protein